MTADAPQDFIEIVLSGLRTDAELLRRLLALVPEEERALRETLLREIELKIKKLESIVSPGAQ
jgi:hypothetical protein